MAMVKSDIEKKLYLGFDLSTQSLTAVVINEQLHAIHSVSVSFDKDFPEFKTTNGVHIRPGGRVTAPTRMFVKALDQALARLHSGDVDLAKVRALSGSGQQHGSVYWRAGAQSLLGDLGGSLGECLENAFAVEDSPIWMDSSTGKQCRDLEDAVGGPQKLAEICGSKAYERFTGNQIAKLYQENAKVYDDCDRISLISSAMASIFIGRYAPIDLSDGSGMNLLDINSRTWSKKLLDATAPGLEEKLGDPVESSTILGDVHSYFSSTFGLSPDCKVIAWSGDNPCSLVGVGVAAEGDICVSLGTSDTFFGITRTPHPSGREGVTLISPVDPCAFVAMLVFKNGSLAREKVRDLTVGADWDRFNEALQSSPAGNDGNIGFYFMEPEITPPCQGIFRFGPNDEPLDKFAPHVEVRAVLESQFMSMRAHSVSLGLSGARRILATGGASRNTHVLQVLSDVFGVRVYTARVGPDTAAYGAALRARSALRFANSKIARESNEENESWNEERTILVCEPNMDKHAVYNSLMKRRTILEDRILSDKCN
eukprot:117745_1